jgi:phospholipase/carboxylesterase
MHDIQTSGKSLSEAKKVAILLHGRGASADSILGLSDHLSLRDFALFAPQAPGNTWYPFSFMAPDEANAGNLKRAIATIDGLVDELHAKSFSSDQIYFIGFSQGACLSLEYATLNARKYGGIIAFTGGLIGEDLVYEKYKGDFVKTPVFIGCSHKDMHVPLQRVQESANLMEQLGANVKTMIFQDTQHTIREEEVDWVNKNILS